MALFERSLTFRVLLIKALQTCSAPLEIRTVNRKARGCVALDKIVNPIHMTRCDEIHHREPYNALVVEECETVRLELMGIRLAAENHSRDDADSEDSDCCGSNCKPALHLVPRASNGEVEGPDEHARSARRAHNLFRRPRRQTASASRPPPTIVRHLATTVR